MAKEQPYVLNRGHELNYRALCNFVAGRSVREGRERRWDDRIPWTMKHAILHRQDYCCAECGQPFKQDHGIWKDVTGDHVIEYQYGGEVTYDNIVLVHKKCNISRTESYSIKTIEAHYGPVDMTMIEDLPVVRFEDRRNKVSIVPMGDKR